MPHSETPKVAVSYAWKEERGGDSANLPEHDSWPRAHHRFDQESVWAVQTALAIGRPLLLRGEPGIGKSQLARAVAEGAQGAVPLSGRR